MGAILSSCSKNGASALLGGASTSVSEASSASAVSGYLSGTAAIGAPLGLAAVSIKGTAGPCATSPLFGRTNSVGVYSIDVSACTAPYYVVASSSNGQVATIASAAGTIANITPLTQLIAQRAAGSEDLLANFAGVTSQELIDKETEIKEVLKGFAVAIGVASDNAAFMSTDLMSGSFSANGSGIDKILDLIKVNDSGPNAANIVVAGQIVAIDIDTPTSVPTAPTFVGTNITDAIAAAAKLNDIRTFASGLSSIFSSGAPTRSQFDQYISSSFLHNGMNATNMFTDLASDSEVAGLQFRNVVVLDETESNYWVSFQIFGVENNQYVLWGTWTSKVENPFTAPKLLGNTMGFGLQPSFLKVSTYSSSNVLSDAATVRGFQIGAFQDLSVYPLAIGNFSIKSIDGATVTNGIKVLNGILDFNHANYASRNVDNLSSEFFKLTSAEGLKPIVKIIYDVLAVDGTTVVSANKEAYIAVPQSAQEVSSMFMDLTQPAFDNVSPVANCSWLDATINNASASSYNISNQNGDYGNVNIYLDTSFLVAPNTNTVMGLWNFDISTLMTEHQDLVTSYRSAATAAAVPNRMRMKTAVLNQYGPGDYLYSHIYKCN